MNASPAGTPVIGGRPGPGPHSAAGAPSRRCHWRRRRSGLDRRAPPLCGAGRAAGRWRPPRPPGGRRGGRPSHEGCSRLWPSFRSAPARLRRRPAPPDRSSRQTRPPTQAPETHARTEPSNRPPVCSWFVLFQFCSPASSRRGRRVGGACRDRPEARADIPIPPGSDAPPSAQASGCSQTQHPSTRDGRLDDVDAEAWSWQRFGGTLRLLIFTSIAQKIWAIFVDFDNNFS